MFLKRIEMQGFKSFADKTIIEFDNPVVYTWYTAPVILAENVAEAAVEDAATDTGKKKWNKNGWGQYRP